MVDGNARCVEDYSFVREERGNLEGNGSLSREAPEIRMILLTLLRGKGMEFLIGWWIVM